MPNVHPDAVFYVNLLADPEVRNRITTPDDCKVLLDQMEDYIPHDELPRCYNWLVARRDILLKAAGIDVATWVHAKILR